MSGRAVRVYRLDIIYPEGSRESGWRPAVWSDPEFLAKLTKVQRRELAKTEFRWPRERMFLSSSGAYGRAGLLEFYGADVEVFASVPVTWPDLEPQTEHWQESAQWLGGVLQREVAEFDPSGLPLAAEIPAEDDGLFGWVDELAEFEGGTVLANDFEGGTHGTAITTFEREVPA
jgi:hypothetical protein